MIIRIVLTALFVWSLAISIGFLNRSDSMDLLLFNAVGLKWLFYTLVLLLVTCQSISLIWLWRPFRSGRWFAIGAVLLNFIETCVASVIGAQDLELAADAFRTSRMSRGLPVREEVLQLMEHQSMHIMPIAVSGVLGVIAILMIYRLQNTHESKEEQDELRSCPNCGRRIATSTSICPRCEQRIADWPTPSTATPRIQQQTETSRVRKCPACGREVKGSICTNGGCNWFGKKIEPATNQVNCEIRPSQPRLLFATPVQQDTERPHRDHYRSALGWAVWLQAMLLLLVALSLVITHQAVSQQKLFMSGLNSLPQTDFEQRLTGWWLAIFATVVVSIALIATMAGWVYAAYQNLDSLYATRVTFSPTSAAVYAMCPVISFATLWPVLLELWEGSDPSRLTQRSVIERFQSPYLIYALLILVLVQLPLGVYALSVLQAEISFNKAISLTNLGIACDVIACLQALVLFLIVNQITRNQSLRHAILNDR